MWYFVKVLLNISPQTLADSAGRFAFKHIRVPQPDNIAVLITGTSSGFGKASVMSLASKGIHVYAGVRKKEDGENLMAELSEKARKHVEYIILGTFTRCNILPHHCQMLPSPNMSKMP